MWYRSLTPASRFQTAAEIHDAKAPHEAHIDVGQPPSSPGCLQDELDEYEDEGRPSWSWWRSPWRTTMSPPMEEPSVSRFNMPPTRYHYGRVLAEVVKEEEEQALAPVHEMVVSVFR